MSERPKRIQLKRTKGWRLPPNTVIVDRRTIYGNPYIPFWEYDLPNCVGMFRDHVMSMIACGMMDLEPLRGKDLACWCTLDRPCHADVLLELANKEDAK